MTSTASVAHLGRDVDDDACLAALAAGEIARVVYHEGALPAVEIVVYDLTDDGVVFAVPAGSGLVGVADGSVLALAVDTVDAAGAGISVLVTGKARTVPAGDGTADGTRTASPRTLVLPLERLSGHRVALRLRRR